MRAKKTSPWVGCFGLAIAMSVQTSVAQEMTKADTEQMQRLVVPMIQADERLKPILLMSAHFGACLSAYEKDFQPERLTTLRRMDRLADEAGRTEMAKLIAEAPANERSDVTALLMGYSVAMRVGASNSVPSLEDCLSTIKTFEAKMAEEPASPLAAAPHAAAPTPSSAAPLADAKSPSTARAGQTFRDCSDCPQMVSIPAGQFTMGSPSSESDRNQSEGPQRRVTVPAFAAGKYEVTWAEWDSCVAASGCAPLQSDGWGGGSRPVTGVSWNHAVAYAKWLSNRTGQAYRLLSEAEWEYAARAGSSGRWSFGESEKPLGSYAWYAANENRQTHPVGTKLPNLFGLYDMYGNVWEWVEDCWANSYAAGQPSDGRAFITDACPKRVSRGGSFADTLPRLRTAYRNWQEPTLELANWGFRVARTL